MTFDNCDDGESYRGTDSKAPHQKPDFSDATNHWQWAIEINEFGLSRALKLQ